MKAVIMAGGEGTRLRPLTLGRPKPMVPVCNKPALEYILDHLKRNGIDEVILTLHYMPEEIIGYFGDGSSREMKILYCVEDEPLGTAGSVLQARRYIDGTFLVLSGDAIMDIDPREIVEFHRQRGALATLTLYRVANPLEYGMVITDEESRIRKFLEKPSWGEVFSDTVNTGMYVLEPEVLDEIEEGRKLDFSKDLFPELLEKGRALFGYVASGYWQDIGGLPSYREAHHDMFTGKVKVQFPGTRNERSIWVGEGTQIDPGAHVKGPAIIGRNCRIKKRVSLGEYTCIGDNCIVEDEALITRSIIWDNVYVGRRARVTDATVCSQSTLNANVVVSEGAILGEKSHIGQGALIHPGVKLWPKKHVDAGATVSLSLIWGSRWPGSLFGLSGITGLANIEVTPEFALKLGAAFGAFMEKNATICTSRDSHPASRMLNRAIICGLLSVGVNVFDLRVMPLPLSRYTVKNQGTLGGIHVRLAPSDSRSVLIEFIDSRGVNIDRATERRIENIFFREDFRLTPPDEVGVIDFPARAIEHYHEGFFNTLNKDLLKTAKFKIVIDYSYGNASLVLPHILGKLGCETVTLNAYLDAFKGRQAQEERGKALRQLAHIVTTLDAHLGILIHLGAERFDLIDEKGQIISGNRLFSLMAAMVMRSTKNAVIAAPVNAPSALEKLAATTGAKVIRTKTDARSLMHTASLGSKRIVFAGDREGGFIFPQFHASFDAIYSLARLLELLALEKRPLSSLVDEIPPFFQSEAVVECEGEHKGKIMRHLIEEHRDCRVEMVEGLKIYRGDSWVLIFPDPIEPNLHLYSEGATREEAMEILDEYLEYVEELKKGDEKGSSPFFAARSAKAPRPKKKDARKATAAKSSVPDEKAFHFWAPGRYLGTKVTSLREFIDTIHYIELESLEFHSERGDFCNWIEYELSHEELAAKLRGLQKRSLKAERLREALLEILERGNN